MTSPIKIRKKNHAYLQIECDDRGILMELSEFFTFTVPGAKFMPSYKSGVWDGRIRLLNNRDNTIYSGLYHHIVKFAETNGRNYEIQNIADPVYGLPNETDPVDDSIIRNTPVTSKGQTIEPCDYQTEAVIHALSNRQALLVSPTASGKSLIIYYICRWFIENRSSENSKILLIVPTTSLVEQMYSDFADYSEYDDSFHVENHMQKIYGGREKSTTTKYKITTEDNKQYTFHGNESIKIINSNIEWKKAKDITENDEIDDTWLNQLKRK